MLRLMLALAVTAGLGAATARAAEPCSTGTTEEKLICLIGELQKRPLFNFGYEKGASLGWTKTLEFTPKNVAVLTADGTPLAYKIDEDKHQIIFPPATPPYLWIATDQTP